MSDEDDLLPVFFEEGREHVETLNLCLLAIERDPGNRDAINDAFRAAHSLKGMSATMGFERIAELTNELEGVLDVVRSGEAQASHDIISTMLLAVDACATIITEIEQHGVEQLGVEHLRDELMAVRNEMLTGGHTEPRQEEDSGEELAARMAAQGIPVLSVEIVVNERSLMPAARAYAALLSLETCGSVLGSEPPKRALEDGLHEGRSITVWLASELPHEEISRAAMTPEVEAANVSPFSRSTTPAATSGPSEGTSTSSGADLRRGRTVRVDAVRLDDLMHGVGELLVRRARVQTLARGLGDSELIDAVDALDRAARELQSLVMDVRMVSVDSVFRRLPRLVRDLADELGKDVRLSISGQDTELDRTVIDVIGDPLVHLVRNALDHGIEGSDVRESKGKSRTGMLDISATTEGGAVFIRVRDDGAGMQPERVREVAVARGVISLEQAADLSDEGAMQLCFAPGFSTRSQANRVSGRGVGLDVVRASVRALSGDVLVESSDEGTVMTIRLPLTLAIRSVLLLKVAGDIYAFHTDRVGQTIDLDLYPDQTVAGQRTLVHLGNVVPLVDLSSVLLGVESDPKVARTAVILDTGTGGGLGVIVDGVLGQSEVVTRALPPAVRVSRFLSASAVLGDGKVAFLINTEAILGEVERSGAFSVVA